ncbi:MAG: hypothetical protein LBB22_03160 [Treponema sp.]|jgi:hypothetical protein|nr:hypothetical protein [Treponema sp.]
MNNRFILASLVSAFLLISCDKIVIGEPPPYIFEFDQEAFDKNRAAWNEQNLQNYTFVFTSKFYPAVSTITRCIVQNGQLSENSEIILGSEKGFTIPDYYERLAEAAQGLYSYLEGGNIYYGELSLSYTVQYYPYSKVWSTGGEDADSSYDNIDCFEIIPAGVTVSKSLAVIPENSDLISAKDFGYDEGLDAELEFIIVKHGSTVNLNAVDAETNEPVTPVNWTIDFNPSSSVTINENGVLKVLSRETLYGYWEFVLVRAAAEDGRYGSLKVFLVKADEKHPTGNNLYISTEPASVVKGGSISCTLMEKKDGKAYPWEWPPVIWSIDRPHVKGTVISPEGILTIDKTETADALIVRANAPSRYGGLDGNYYATARVTVMEQPRVPEPSPEG